MATTSMRRWGKLLLAVTFSIATGSSMLLAQSSAANAVPAPTSDPNWCDHEIRDLDMPDPETYPGTDVTVGDKCPAVAPNP
jgi:hypothetical protein